LHFQADVESLLSSLRKKERNTVIYIDGPVCSGKTTLCKKIQNERIKDSNVVVMLENDAIWRPILKANLGGLMSEAIQWIHTVELQKQLYMESAVSRANLVRANAFEPQLPIRGQVLVVETSLDGKLALYSGSVSTAATREMASVWKRTLVEHFKTDAYDEVFLWVAASQNLEQVLARGWQYESYITPSVLAEFENAYRTQMMHSDCYEVKGDSIVRMKPKYVPASEDKGNDVVKDRYRQSASRGIREEDCEFLSVYDGIMEVAKHNKSLGKHTVVFLDGAVGVGKSHMMRALEMINIAENEGYNLLKYNKGSAPERLTMQFFYEPDQRWKHILVNNLGASMSLTFDFVRDLISATNVITALRIREGLMNTPNHHVLIVERSLLGHGNYFRSHSINDRREILNLESVAQELYRSATGCNELRHLYVNVTNPFETTLKQIVSRGFMYETYINEDVLKTWAQAAIDTNRNARYYYSGCVSFAEVDLSAHTFENLNSELFEPMPLEVTGLSNALDYFQVGSLEGSREYVSITYQCDKCCVSFQVGRDNRVCCCPHCGEHVFLQRL